MSLTIAVYLLNGRVEYSDVRRPFTKNSLFSLSVLNALDTSNLRFGFVPLYFLDLVHSVTFIRDVGFF